MTQFDRFFKSPTEGETLVGTYLWPLLLFADRFPVDKWAAIEVIHTIKAGQHNILITRNGGLFSKPPPQFSDLYRRSEHQIQEQDLDKKILFQADIAEVFNQLICELALAGLVSEPVSPVDISRGQLIDGHALITSARGGRELYTHRTAEVALALINNMWRMWRVHSEGLLAQASNLEATAILGTIGKSLPTLIAGAYHYFSRQRLSEALVDAWVVTEQLLDSLWEQYVEPFDVQRRTRLSDERTYTAAVQIELLRTAGVIEPELYNMLQKARKHRNNLAHRAVVSLDTALETLQGMKTMIEFVCKRTVVDADISQGVNW